MLPACTLPRTSFLWNRGTIWWASRDSVSHGKHLPPTCCQSPLLPNLAPPVAAPSQVQSQWGTQGPVSPPARLLLSPSVPGSPGRGRREGHVGGDHISELQLRIREGDVAGCQDAHPRCQRGPHRALRVGLRGPAGTTEASGLLLFLTRRRLAPPRGADGLCANSPCQGSGRFHGTLR